MARVSPHPAIDGFNGGSRPFQRLEEMVAMAQQHALTATAVLFRTETSRMDRSKASSSCKPGTTLLT